MNLSIKGNITDNLKGSGIESISTVSKFIDFEEPKDDPVKHIYLARQVSINNSKTKWQAREDCLDLVELQDESIHRNSLIQDKSLLQIERRLNVPNGRRNPEMNNNDTTFKPKYFSNFTSEVNPQTAPLNHNSIKFNEKNISGVSYTDVCQKEINIAELNREDLDNERDPEFLNTLMRLKGQETPMILSSLNENFISKSITNLQNICNIEDSKIGVKDLIDSCKIDRTNNDLIRSEEIDGISRIDNKSSSNLLNDTRSIFSSSKIFRISSPELLENAHLESKISVSSDKKKNSDQKSSQIVKKNRVLITSIEKGLNLQGTYEKFSKQKRYSNYNEAEEKVNKEVMKGSKIFVIKRDKNLRYSGLDFDEGVKKDNKLIAKDNKKKPNLKERKREIDNNLSSSRNIKIEKKCLMKSCMDNYSSNKLRSCKKRTISSENITNKNTNLVQTVKVDLHNISTKYESNFPLTKINYFDDNVQTTDMVNLATTKSNNELQDGKNKECLEILQTLKQSKLKDSFKISQNTFKHSKNDILNRKVDIQHIEINLFTNHENEHIKENFDNYYDIIIPIHKADNIGSYEIIKTSTHLYPVLDKNLEFNIENPEEKSSHGSKFYNNYCNDTHINEINFCNKSLDPLNNDLNNVESNNVLITNYNNETFNNFNFSKFSGYPINTNMNNKSILATNPNQDNDLTNKNLVTSYNYVKTTECNNILIEDNEVFTKMNENPRITFQSNDEILPLPVLSAEINLYEDDLHVNAKNIYLSPKDIRSDEKQNLLPIESQKNILSIETAIKHPDNKINIFHKKKKTLSLKGNQIIVNKTGTTTPDIKARKVQSPDLTRKNNKIIIKRDNKPMNKQLKNKTKNILNKSDNNQGQVPNEMRLDSLQVDEVTNTVGREEKRSNRVLSPFLSNLITPKGPRESNQRSIKVLSNNNLSNPPFQIKKLENKIQKIKRNMNPLKDYNVFFKKGSGKIAISSPKAEINLSKPKLLTPKYDKKDFLSLLSKKNQKKEIVNMKRFHIKRNSISETDNINDQHVSKHSSKIDNKRLNRRKSEVNYILKRINSSNEKDKKCSTKIK